jgi:hypothetical protein
LLRLDDSRCHVNVSLGSSPYDGNGLLKSNYAFRHMVRHHLRAYDVCKPRPCRTKGGKMARTECFSKIERLLRERPIASFTNLQKQSEASRATLFRDMAFLLKTEIFDHE